MKRFGAALLLLPVLVGGSLAAGPALDPAGRRSEIDGRISRIQDDMRLIDARLRTPGLAEQDFRALQDLRTSLAQERRVLEEQGRVLAAVSSSPPLMLLVAGSTSPASDVQPRTLWEAGGWARFEGVLPCAGCDGVKTEITLYNDGLKYVMVERYLGTGAPRRTFETDGVWTTLRGHGDDPDATVFQLDYDKPGRERNFLRVSDLEIRLLDLDESKLKKKPNLVLKKTAP